MKRALAILILVFLVFTSVAFSYEVDPPGAVHQYITKQSCLLSYIPELQEYCKSEYDREIDGSYNSSIDDLVSSSGEEDKDYWSTNFYANRNHFWNPDFPLSTATYDVGLNDVPKVVFTPYPYLAMVSGPVDSSYRKSLNYWQTKVIPLYLKGDINQSYYWLGRVAHLLEDATQPSHVLLDPHPPGDTSLLEHYTADNLGTIMYEGEWQGENYVGDQYDYTNLIPGFDWDTVKPANGVDQINPELFRLFWYTAQKTQYWASDDYDGNHEYVRTDNGQTAQFSCDSSNDLNLWKAEGLDCERDIISDHNDFSSANVNYVARNMIPHAMKANGALFELFWNTVQSRSWPTFYGNNQRTGYSYLKGDLSDSTSNKEFSYSGKNNTDFKDSPAFGNLDGDEKMEIIVGTATETTPTYGRVFALDDNGKEMWSTTTKLKDNKIAVGATPDIADLNGDGKNEVIFGDRKGRLRVINCKKLASISVSPGTERITSDITSFAVADVNYDGTNCINLISRGLL